MKYALMLAAAAAALSLCACGKSSTDKAQDAASAAASTTADAASAAVNKAEDATGAAVGAASANTTGSLSTDAFVSNLTQSGLYEIKAAQIAQRRSKDPDVKAFAAMMVKDHTAMDTDLKPKIQAAGQTPAAALDNRRSGFIDHLNSASDADFDKTYVDQQVSGHQEALDLLKGYADKGSDPVLKAAAGQAEPKVQEHLDRARSIQARLSSSPAPAKTGG
jgi:putative membrane protein